VRFAAFKRLLTLPPALTGVAVVLAGGSLKVRSVFKSVAVLRSKAVSGDFTTYKKYQVQLKILL
jgi:hypothetical protein